MAEAEEAGEGGGRSDIDSRTILNVEAEESLLEGGGEGGGGTVDSGRAWLSLAFSAGLEAAAAGGCGWRGGGGRGLRVYR